jgi:ribosomal protein S18 acetylase RimI-like enzyme
MGVNIREMKEGDIPQICGIQETITKKKVPKHWIGDLKDHIKKNKKACFAGTSGKDIVGFIIGNVKTLEYGLEKSGWIVTLGVDPKFMGRGVGRALGKRLLSHFKKVGCRDVYTSVQWDSTDLLAFFKSIGFKRSEFINLEQRI